MRSPMITQGLQGSMAGSLFAFKCGWNPFEELADDQEQDGDSDVGINHTDPYEFLTMKSRSAERNTTEESISNSQNHHRFMHCN